MRIGVALVVQVHEAAIDGVSGNADDTQILEHEGQDGGEVDANENAAGRTEEHDA